MATLAREGRTNGCTTSGEVKLVGVVGLSSPPRDPLRYAIECMTDRIAKLKARDKAMRQSRDKMLRRVAQHLTMIGFAKAGTAHFVRESDDQTDHIGFQKHSSGRDVRVMAHIVLNDSTGTIIDGPWSDAYTRPNSPNGIRYNFGWTTNDEGIVRCAEEFCRFIDDVLITWFANPIPQPEKA